MKMPKTTNKGLIAVIAVSILAVLILLAAIALETLRGISSWFDNNTLAFNNPVRFEIEFKPLIAVVAREKVKVDRVFVDKQSHQAINPENLTQENKEQIIKASGFSDAIEGIWNLETSKGKAPEGHHKDCEELGLTNEFGYGALDNVCFDSFQQSVDVVNAWLKKNLETKSLSETLCFYNKGTNESDCDYYRNFRTVAQLTK